MSFKHCSSAPPQLRASTAQLGASRQYLRDRSASDPFPAAAPRTHIPRLGDQLARSSDNRSVWTTVPARQGFSRPKCCARGAYGYTSRGGGAAVDHPALSALPYYTLRDSVPITLAERSSTSVSLLRAAKTVPDFIEWRRNEARVRTAAPVRASIISPANSSRLARAVTHVPYKGCGAALVDLISGDLHSVSTYVVSR